MIPAGCNSSSVSNLAASAGNSAGSAERANPTMLSAGDSEDSNTASSQIASPTVVHAGDDDNNAASLEIAGGMTVVLAGEENKAATPATLLAGEEKGSDSAPKFSASPAKLHDGDNSKSGTLSAGADSSAARSKLPSPAVLHAAGDRYNNGRSKQIASLAAPHATGSKLDDSPAPAVLHAGEHSNPDTGYKVPKPVARHGSEGTENNAGRPAKFPSVDVVSALPACMDKKARTRLAIQAAPHAGGNTGPSTRLTRSAAAALQAAKDIASKLADVQVVPRFHAGKDNNNVGSSSSKAAARRPAAPRAAENADHELHIFTERERRKKMKNMFSTLPALLPALPDKADKATIVGESVTFIQSLERITAEVLQQMMLERQREAAQQQQYGKQQQLAVGGAGSSSSRASSSARQPAPAPPAPASREATLADMVHGWELQAAVAAANKALAAAAAGSSSSSSSATQQLPRGAVPIPALAAGFQTWSDQNVVVSVGDNEAYINLHVPRQLDTLTKVLFVLERHHLDVVTTTVSTQDGFRMYSIHARANPVPASAPSQENLSAEDRFKLAVSEIVQLVNV